MIALVVWPGAPSVPSNAPGSLSVSGGGGSFTIQLTYDRTNGTTAKWQGVVPSGQIGDLVINSGWVLDTGDVVRNLPYSFKYGDSCTPTAVEINSLSAHSQSQTSTILIWTLALTALGLVVVRRQ